MTWIIRLIKGTIVGIGAILPGLSGGVMAVIFGIYDPFLKFLSDLRRDFWKNVRFFIPIVLGVGLGVLLFSAFVEKALGGKYEAMFVCLFIGFVVGTLPSLYRTAGREGRGTTSWVALFLSAVFIFVLMMLGEGEILKITPSIPVWFLAGIIIGLGFVVPGLSPSNFLMYFGLYLPMSTNIKNLEFTTILPLGLGVALCALLFARFMSLLLKKHYAVVYHVILGLVIGSSVAIFPKIVFPALEPAKLAAADLSLLLAVGLCVLMFVIGMIGSYLFSKLEGKYEHKSLFET